MKGGKTLLKSYIAPPTDPNLLRVLKALRDAGAKAWIVGGWVRDALLGQASKDVDIEVFGMDAEQLCAALEPFGEVHRVGQAFPIVRVKGLDVDFSLPRADSLIGAGRGDLARGVDPLLNPALAAQRRDLTINAMAFDPLSETLFDPLGGLDDLRDKRLRAASAERFGDDPIRALRVAELMARLEFEPNAELISLCRQQDLAQTAPERRFEALRKLLVRGVRPSIGLAFLRHSGLLRFFAELQALIHRELDPAGNGGSDSWTHTLQTVDQANVLRRTAQWLPADGALALMFAALCHHLGHEFGQGIAQIRVSPGAVQSSLPQARQATLAARLSQQFLASMLAPKRLGLQVAALVEQQHAPDQFHAEAVGDQAYRRLARQLHRAEVTMRLLECLARAIQLARSTPRRDAIDGRAEYLAGDEFVARAEQLCVLDRMIAPAVLGRHVIARGIEPGPMVGIVLEHCIEIQDQTGWDSHDRILDEALERLRRTD